MELFTIPKLNINKEPNISKSIKAGRTKIFQDLSQPRSALHFTFDLKASNGKSTQKTKKHKN